MKSLFKMVVLISAVLVMVVGFSCPTSANVAGNCSNCHTMHYSQNGVSTMYEANGPFPILLTGSCIGCHTGDADPLDDGDNTPYVASSSSSFTDSKCLAGGFFPGTMGEGNNADEHHGIGNINNPAGMTIGAFYTQGITGLGCAGINGCHGNETDLSDMKAIKGGHHKTSSTYRMLYVGDNTVCGSGAEDYEEAVIDNVDPLYVLTRSGAGQNVNIYSSGTVGATESTISELCGKCHGDFHGAEGTPANGTTNAAGEWIRHPSDYSLPTTWIMGATDYDFDADDAKHNPFGYDNAIYTQGSTQVTCLSCHRAHGTANQDLLRWGYAGGDLSQTQVAGTSAITYGCLGCHDAQR